VPHQIAVEIAGKKVPEDDVREGQGEMVGRVDAGYRMGNQFIGQIG